MLANWLNEEVTETDSPFVCLVQSREWGDFSVELDTQYVSGDEELERKIRDIGLPIGDKGLELSRDLGRRIRDAIGELSTGLVPTEIVTPPIPWNRLDDLNELTEALRSAGAQGTNENPLYGFGLHLNPELFSDDPVALLSVLRAYVLLSAWLRDQIGVDATRELLPHVDPFPRSYASHILDPDYAPTLSELIADYVEMNPTRNRELDMLPAFAHLAPRRLESLIEDDRIKPRPTFHYRLPNVVLCDPDWSVVTEWNRWVAVETLAADEDNLTRMSRNYLESKGEGTLAEHLREITLWLKDRIPL